MAPFRCRAYGYGFRLCLASIGFVAHALGYLILPPPVTIFKQISSCLFLFQSNPPCFTDSSLQRSLSTKLFPRIIYLSLLFLHRNTYILSPSSRRTYLDFSSTPSVIGFSFLRTELNSLATSPYLFDPLIPPPPRELNDFLRVYTGSETICCNPRPLPWAISKILKYTKIVGPFGKSKGILFTEREERNRERLSCFYF